MRSSATLMQAARTPVCFVHMGTHKTGTTALQRWLVSNAPMLSEAGIYVPQAGRYSASGGHHNLAWELNEDERFEQRYGTLAQAVDEVAGAGLRSVCLSSEDFEYLHAKPQALERIRAAFAGIGYTAVAVLYLRPQASYAESLYAELVKHGFTRTFDEYLAAILRDGLVTFGQTWRFTFDYARLVDDVAAVFGAQQTIVRPYTGPIAGGLIVPDFLRIAGAQSQLTALAASPVGRLNASPSFGAVIEAFERNVAAARTVPEDAPRGTAHGVRGRFDPVRLPEVARIAARFAAGNQHVLARYGAAIPYIGRRDLCADVAAALGFDHGSDARRSVVRAQGRPPAPRRPVRMLHVP